jgi:hypothetical protein
MKIDWRTAFGCAGLLAVVGILVLSVRWGSRDRAPRPEQGVVAAGLKLQGFHQIRGTDVFRAALSDGSGSYRSGYGRARNILFVEASGEARWLLKDDDHVLEEHAVPEPASARFGEDAPAPVAMVVLARPESGESRTGDLYLSDPVGRRAVRIAQNVREVDGVALAPDGVAVLYEAARGYVLAHYAIADFKMLREVDVTVPVLQ